MWTTAAVAAETFAGSTLIFSAAVRSQGAPRVHVRSLPTATPACCETFTHDLFALTRQGTTPVPVLAICALSAGVADWPGRTLTSTIGRSTRDLRLASATARRSQQPGGAGSCRCAAASAWACPSCL